jgi:hypothetical protein
MAVLMLRHPDDAVIVDAIIAEADEVLEDWRNDLATRIANALQPHFKALGKALGG